MSVRLFRKYLRFPSNVLPDAPAIHPHQKRPYAPTDHGTVFLHLRFLLKVQSDDGSASQSAPLSLNQTPTQTPAPDYLSVFVTGFAVRFPHRLPVDMVFGYPYLSARYGSSDARFPLRSYIPVPVFAAVHSALRYAQ